MSLAHFSETIYTSDGQTSRPAPEATVTFYLTGTTTEADLYTTIAGTTAATNPASADDDGLVSVYLQPGIYDIDITTAAGTDSRTGVVLVGHDRIVTANGTSHTATLANNGDTIQFDATGNGTIALPASVDAGFVVFGTNLGGGACIFDPPTGETIIGSLSTAATQTLAACRKVTASVWQLTGDVS